MESSDVLHDGMRGSSLSVFRIFLFVLFISGLFSLDGYAREDMNEQSLNVVESEQIVQTECPVMVGNKIDPNIYVDYEGKRVFFCCNICKSAFIKEPEKYLHRLPQFASLDAAHNDHDLHSHQGFESILGRLIVPMGISTLSLIAVTVFLSVFRRLNIRFMMKWHKRAGIATLISGAIHAILVLIAH